MIKKLFTFIALLLTAEWLVAQVPAGYYTTAKGEKGRLLKTALHKAIKNHEVCSYSSLLEHFKKTDRRADGKVWDMYSNTTNYSFSGGSTRYSGEGAGYNREHSFPKSWFGGKIAPMYTDLFHIYPTDGYANNRRWHYPYGETKGEKYQTDGGWSKLGNCTTPGYDGVVFEPNDEYKGDFARTYFYMATCYEDKIAGWHTINGKEDGEKVVMLDGTSYPAFAKWALDMLLRWAKQDPVSQKEIDRNNAVYGIQKNRNPYIDFPGLEDYIWGNKQTVAFDPDHYDSESGGGEIDPSPNPDPVQVADPVFSIASGAVKAGTAVTINCETGGATIYYQVNGGIWQSQYAPVTLTVVEDIEVEAYAMVGQKKSNTVSATYTLAKAPVFGEGVYSKVYGAQELEVGCRYLIVCESKSLAMAEAQKDIRGYANVDIADDVVKTEVSAAGLPYAFVLGHDAKGYTFFDESSHTYLALTSNGNNLYSVTSADGDESHWTLDVKVGETLICSVKYPERAIKYNAAHPRFATYRSGQTPVVLYKETVTNKPEKPEAPVFSLPSGEVEQGSRVTISCETPDAVIYYRLNEGEYVSGASPVILDIQEDVTIEAYAEVKGIRSDAVSATYTLKPEVIEVAAPVFSLPSGEVEKGSKVTISCDTPGAVIYYRLNAGEYLSDASPVTLNIQEDVTVEAYAEVKGFHSDTVSASYTLKPEVIEVAAPVFSLPSGEVERGSKVTIRCNTPGAVIYYRLNAGEFVSGASPVILDIQEDVTVEAYAEVKGFRSETVSASYTLKPEVIEVAAPVFSLPSGEVEKGSQVTISCDTPAAVIYYRLNAGEYLSGASPVTLDIQEDVAIEAYAEVKGFRSETVKVAYTMKTVTAIEHLLQSSQKVDVYALDGRLLRRQVEGKQLSKDLPSGVYLVNGIKVVLK